MASAYSLTLSASLCMSTASHATAGSIRSDTASVKSVSLQSVSGDEDPEVMTLIKDQVDRLVKALKYKKSQPLKMSLGNLESADKVPAICGDDADRAIDIALQSPRHLETL